jgi:hypothetical protein
MEHDMPFAARPRRARASSGRGKLAVLLLPLSLGVALAHPVTTLAVTPETATINIAGVQASLAFPCRPNCNSSLTGLSSGDITGVDGNDNAYEVAWSAGATSANFSGTLNVTAVCGPNAIIVTGGTASGTFTVSNASLLYGGVLSNASVTGAFSGDYVGGVLVPVVNSLTVTGASTLTLTPTKGAGAIAMTPTPPIGDCTTSQSYTLSGPMLTAA